MDYLIIDTPPGTSDEHLSVVESLASFLPDGAVLVTTPQEVAVADVRKEIDFCVKTKLPIIGIVENMSGFVCPHCAECSNIFATGGGESLAKQFALPFLGRIPIDPRLGQSLEAGASFVSEFSDSAAAKACQAICDIVVKTK